MSPAPRVWWRDATATAALAGYSLAVALGFARVFSGWAFMSDLVLIVAVGHGLSFALRRAHVSGWFAIPATAAVLVWVGSLMHYRDTLQFGIPWSATWDQLTLELGVVRDEFPTAVAPVFYGAGWAPLATIAMILIVVMSDSFAFRAEARGEALVPGGVLFVFIAALGTERLQLTITGALIATGVVAVIALRQLHERSRPAVLSSRSRALSGAAPAALGVAVCIAVLAGVIGPRLPGAGAEPLYDTKGRNGTNRVANPLVDIRSRLTNLGNVELFRVNATEERYWRLMTLAEFTGEQFVMPGRPLAQIDDVAGSVADGNRIVQQVQILALQGELVPAAADPIQASLTRATGERSGLRQQPASNALLAPDELRPGDVFDVVSEEPAPTTEQLRAATVRNVPDPVYLELPDDVPDILFEQTAELTAGLSTPFDQALALQAWFRDETEFEYSLEVQSGHGLSAIESFFKNRAGYCEQFAATFAAMARAAGIPSRVAVGYTPGEATEDEVGWLTVIGKNAHAWPELWFDGIGWVSFEPTPGRGAPGAAEGYTGLLPQQEPRGDTAAGGDIGEPGGEPTPTAPPTVVTTPDGGSVPSTTIRPDPGDAADPGSPLVLPDQTGPGADELAELDQEPAFPWKSVSLALAIALALGAPAISRRVRKLQRRHRGPNDQIAAAWERATSAAADAGVVSSPSMTAAEWTAATAVALPVAARPMASLADVVDRVTYCPPGSIDLHDPGTLGNRLSDDCVLWAEQVERMAVDTLPTTKRVKRYFVDFG